MWHAVYDSTSGALVSVGEVVADDTILTEKGMARKELGDVFDAAGRTWDPVARAFSAPAVVHGLVSLFAFKSRFTRAERIAIRKNADANIADFMELLGSSATVDLDSPIVIAGVNYLRDQAVITAPRALVILAAP